MSFSSDQKGYKILRNDILSGYLIEGQTININKICEERKISHIPIREGLIRLAERDLIEWRSHQGFFVRTLSIEECVSIYNTLYYIYQSQFRAAFSKNDPTIITKLNLILKGPIRSLNPITANEYYGFIDQISSLIMDDGLKNTVQPMWDKIRLFRLHRCEQTIISEKMRMELVEAIYNLIKADKKNQLKRIFKNRSKVMFSSSLMINI